MNATIVDEGYGWTVRLEGGEVARFSHLAFPREARAKAEEWARAKGATVLTWDPCPARHWHHLGTTCKTCGVRG